MYTSVLGINYVNCVHFLQKTTVPMEDTNKFWKFIPSQMGRNNAHIAMERKIKHKYMHQYRNRDQLKILGKDVSSRVLELVILESWGDAGDKYSIYITSRILSLNFCISSDFLFEVAYFLLFSCSGRMKCLPAAASVPPHTHTREQTRDAYSTVQRP